MHIGDRVLIRKVLCKHGFLLPKQSLPEPIHQFEGKQEELSSYVFQLLDGSLLLVKTGTARALSMTWKQINAFRQGDFPASLLPVDKNREEDGLLIYRDGYWALSLLERLRIFSAQDKPIVSAVFTGLGGFSRLYLFQGLSATRTTPRAVVVKFDRPDRMANEWAAIGKLRSSNLQLREMLLPVYGNEPSDTLIVSDVYHSLTRATEVMRLDDFVSRNIGENAAAVSRCLGKLEEFLQALYRDAQNDNGVARWHSLFPELERPKAANSIIMTTTPFAAFVNPKQTFYTEGLPFVGGFENPTQHLKDQLEQATGRLRIGPTHGDLQTSNVLVGHEETDGTLEIAAIDFEKFEFQGPLIKDLVRFEADFWRSIACSELVAEKFFSSRIPSDRLASTLTGIVMALDITDQRVPRIANPDPQIRLFASNLSDFIMQWRQMSAKLLGRSNLPAMYFTALRLYYLESLLRPMTAKNAVRSKVAFLCSSLAFTKASEIYAGGAPAGPPVKADSTEVGRAPQSRQKSRGTAGPLWKPAIIKSSIYKFARVESDCLYLKASEIRSAKSFVSTAASKQLVEIGGKLNASAFRRTPHRGTDQEKISRNASHVERNPSSIMLIKAPAFRGFRPGPLDFIGFSHVLPLTIAGYDKYVRGEEKDNDFSADSICRPNQRAHALLFFSLAIDPSAVKRLYTVAENKGVLASGVRDELWATLTSRLLSTAAFHLVTLMKEQGRLSCIKLITQLDDDETIATLGDTLKLRRSGVVTADQLIIRSTVCRLERPLNKRGGRP